MNKKQIELLQSILEEFDDYSGYSNNNWKLEDTNEEESFISLAFPDVKQGVSLMITNEAVYVWMPSENWEQIETFEWTIKYLWIALLS